MKKKGKEKDKTNKAFQPSHREKKTMHSNQGITKGVPLCHLLSLPQSNKKKKVNESPNRFSCEVSS